MRSAIRHFIQSQQFSPGPVGVFLNPFFIARRALRQEIADASKELSGRLLDVGCGTQPYRDLLGHCIYIGMDIDSPRTRGLDLADAYYDGTCFPFEDASFNSVVCNQVLEHVFNPDEFVAELRRVLAPNGRLLLTVPFVWDEHEQPWDYARYSSYGLRALLERHGFELMHHRKLVANASLLFQLTIAYLCKTIPRAPTPLSLLITALLYGPLTLLGLLAGAVLPDNRDLFLDQLVLAKSTT